MNYSSLYVERSPNAEYTDAGALIYVFRKDGGCPVPAEEIALRTGQILYKVSFSLSETLRYPTPFMDLVRLWKKIMREEADSRKSAMIGSGTGASLILSLSQWCRDHGIPLPSSLVLDSAVYGTDTTDSDIKEYLSTADADDPYAYPLLGDYFLFPPISLHDSDGRMMLLRNRMRKSGVTCRYSRNSVLLFSAGQDTEDEYISSVSAFIRQNMS